MIKLENFWLRVEQILFYILIFLIPFSTGFIFLDFSPSFDAYYTQGLVYLSDFVIAAIFLLWLKRLVTNHHGPRRETFLVFIKNLLRLEWAYLLLVAFLVFSLISAARAQFSEAAFYQVFKLIEFAVLFFYLKSNFGRLKISMTVAVFAISALIQALFVFLQYGREDIFTEKLSALGGIFLLQTSFLRAAGTFEHPFLLAVFVGLVAMVVYFLIIRGRFFFDLPNPEFLSSVREQVILRESFRRIGMIILFFVFILALFLTFSRSIIFVFLVAFVFYNTVLFLDRKTRQTFSLRLVYALGIFLFSIILITTLLWPETAARFSPQRILAQPETIVFDETALQVLKENPRFGIGPGNYIFYLIENQGDSIEETNLQPVNNLYWLVAAEVGLTGLIIIVGFLIWFLFKMLELALFQGNPEVRVRNWIMFWGVIFVLMSAFFGHFFWTAQSGRLIFWLVLGIGAYYISHKMPVVRSQ
jgi:hypothetical protein